MEKSTRKVQRTEPTQAPQEVCSVGEGDIHGMYGNSALLDAMSGNSMGGLGPVLQDQMLSSTRAVTTSGLFPAFGSSRALMIANDSARLEACLTTIRGALHESETMLDSYTAVRDALNGKLVQEIGTGLITSVHLMEGGKAATETILRSRPQGSGVPTQEEALEYKPYDRAATELRALSSAITQRESQIAAALTPSQFQGLDVAETSVVPSLAGLSVAAQGALLAEELGRTGSLLATVQEIASLDLEQDISCSHAQELLAKVGTRPLDLAFLRAALGPLWEKLDRDAAGMGESERASVLMERANKNASRTGWLADTAGFELDSVITRLESHDDNAQHVFAELRSTTPAVMARLLEQLRASGKLDALCNNNVLPWMCVKALHDKLPTGKFVDLENELRTYFLDPDLDPDGGISNISWKKAKGGMRYGHAIDRPWEERSSTHKMIESLPGGDKINKVVNGLTWGFHSDYGQNYDARAQGTISNRDFRRNLGHIALKTAIVGAISSLTGGVAGAAVGKGVAAWGAGRILQGVVGGAAGGAVGGVWGLAAGDAYDVYGSKTKDQFSSGADYVEAALLGGAVGGVLGGLHAGLAGRGQGASGPRGALPAGPGEAVPATGEAAPAASETAPATGEATTAEPVRNPRTEPTSKYDLGDAKTRRHILDGDETGGGHRPGRGVPGKTEFPRGWSDEQIMRNVSDIATDPKSTAGENNSNKLYNKNGDPIRNTYYGVREGVKIKVVVEPATHRIVTAYPVEVLDPVTSHHPVTGQPNWIPAPSNPPAQP